MTDIEQVVVVVPAHNELEHLPRCLRALTTAALCIPVPVLIVVVLDACDDGSERLAGQFGPDVHFVSVDAGNVGAARAAGFEYARDRCPCRVRAHVVRDHRRRQYGECAVVTSDDLRRRRHGAGVVRIPAWRHFPAEVAAGIYAHITRKARATTTFTARTWASAPTPTGVSAASGHCPPARTSSWSNASRPQACASTATPSCRWRRRIDARAARRAASLSTCAALKRKAGAGT